MKNIALINRLNDEEPNLEIAVQSDLQSNMDVLAIFRDVDNKLVLRVGGRH